MRLAVGLELIVAHCVAEELAKATVLVGEAVGRTVEDPVRVPKRLAVRVANGLPVAPLLPVAATKEGDTGREDEGCGDSDNDGEAVPDRDDKGEFDGKGEDEWEKDDDPLAEGLDVEQGEGVSVYTPLDEGV